MTETTLLNSLDEELSDDDDNDEDFNPEEADKEELSADSNSSEDEVTEEPNSRKRKFRTKKKGSKRRKKHTDGEADELSYSDDDDSTSGSDLADKTVFTEEEEKVRTDKLWSEFISSVETDKQKKKQSHDAKPEKTITKTFEYAGQTMTVEQKAYTTEQNRGGFKSKKRGLFSRPALPFSQKITFLSGEPDEIGLGNGQKGGLSAVLSVLQSKKHTTNLTTLEKSKLDWEAFKKQNNLEEDLQNHTKSKDTYLEKQEFLQRADLRQFEIEKNMRIKRRRNPV